MTKNNRKIIGAIFPITPKHVLPLFNGRSDVFVKFTKLVLKEGMTIIFYGCGLKRLVGEGKIAHIKKLSPEEAWVRYKGRIFLNKKEYDNYVKTSPITRKSRKMNEITVFVLSNLQKYHKDITPKQPITPSGRYLSRNL